MLNRFLEYDPGYVAPCKEAMEMLGIKVGSPRKPMPGLTDAERAGVRAALQELGTDLMKTGFIWDERFAWFYSGFDRRPSPFYQPHPSLDTRETKERIRELLVVSGLADKLISRAGDANR